jgi:hypothetical protein
LQRAAHLVPRIWWRHPHANCAIPDEASMLDAIRIEWSEYPKVSEKFKGVAPYCFSYLFYTVNRLSLR